MALTKTKTKRVSKKVPPVPKSNAIKLPTIPNEPPKDLSRYTLCIYGEKGIGKSTLASGICDPDTTAHFMLEPGRLDLSSKLIPDPTRAEPPLTWERFKAYVDLLCQPDSPITRIIIDTIDQLSTLAETHWKEKLNLSSIRDLNDYGKTWNLLLEDFRSTLNRLIYSGIAPIFISHCRFRPIVLRSISRNEQKAMLKAGTLPEQVQPTCPGWAWDYLKQVANYAFFYGYEGADRSLYIRGSETIWSSCGPSGHFMQPSTSTPKTKGKGSKIERPGEPLEILPMGSSPEQSAKNLLASFENKLVGEFYTD